MFSSPLLYKGYNKLNTIFNSFVTDIGFIALWWLIMTRYLFYFRPTQKVQAVKVDLGDTNFLLSETAILAYIAIVFTIFVELYISKRIFKFKSYLKKIFAKLFMYITLIVTIILLGNSVLELQLLSLNSSNHLHEGFRYFLLGGFMLSVIIIPMNVIRDLASMLGFKMFLAKVFGYYYAPKEENRIFMFLDMVDSTKTAEKLGHVQFSMLIKDLVNDLSVHIKKRKGSVYQYVGDEVILTWNGNYKNHFVQSIQLFYDFKENLLNKKDYYLNKYNVLPQFKASINMGKVTVVEIGVAKKEIVYHGDVLNTAARVQKLCKKYNKELLACETFVEKLEPIEGYYISPIDQITIEGKEKKEIIHSVEVG